MPPVQLSERQIADSPAAICCSVQCGSVVEIVLERDLL